jgi:serine/threonine protein kinase
MNPEGLPGLGNLPVNIRSYQLHSVLGRGGYGVVYQAWSRQYNLDFAVKVTPFEQETCSWVGVTNEVNALKSLDHPNIIRVYDFFVEGECIFLVLELCQQGTLENRIRNNVIMSSTEKMSIAAQIVSALNYCHKKGLAHRDIKASNILFDRHGRVKLSDFGLATEMVHREKISDFKGSQPYAPPEVWKRSEYDPFAADIWSLGVLFYRLIRFDYPWPMHNREAMKSAILLGHYIPIPFMENSDMAALTKLMIVVDPSERISMTALADLGLWTSIGAKLSSTLTRTIRQTCSGSLPRPGSLALNRPGNSATASVPTGQMPNLGLIRRGSRSLAQTSTPNFGSFAFRRNSDS